MKDKNKKKKTLEELLNDDTMSTVQTYFWLIVILALMVWMVG